MKNRAKACSTSATLHSQHKPKKLTKSTRRGSKQPSTQLIRRLSTVQTNLPPNQPSTNPELKLPKFTLIRNEKVSLAQRQVNPERRRVVVTGIGVVSPLGNNIDQVYASILNAESAIKSIDTPELTKLNLQAKSYAPVGNIPEVDNPDIIPRHLKQLLSRHQVYAMVATHNAMMQAGLIKPKKIDEEKTEEHNSEQNDDQNQNGTDQKSSCQLGHETLCDLCEDEPKCVYQRDETDRFGICIGSSIGCVEEIGAAHVKVQDKGGKGAGAYSLPKLLVNLAAGHLTQLHQARALTHTVSTACATGAHAIGDGAAFIRDKKADIIIAGGTETGVSPLSLSLFNRIHALSRQPADSSGGPFASQRDGFVMGEGAAVLILEEAEHAKKRGAHVICEVLGYGLSADAYHITQPHRLGRGAYMAMENALKDAGIDMGSVDYVNAHATSTPIGDIAEASAIRALTQVHYSKRKMERMKRIRERARGTHKAQNDNKDKNDHSESNSSESDSPSPPPKASLHSEPLKHHMFSRPLVSSTKGHVGHLLGAAGALEAALSIMAITTNSPPPTLLRGGEISDNIPVNVLAFKNQELASTNSESSRNAQTNAPIITTHWENSWQKQSTFAKANMPSLESMVENVDYYINNKGQLVFSEKYHVNKGYCCENACLNCPYDFTTEKLTGMKQGGLKAGQLTQPGTNSRSQHDIDVVMTNSFGFGGANSTLIFGRYLPDTSKEIVLKEGKGIDSF